MFQLLCSENLLFCVTEQNQRTNISLLLENLIPISESAEEASLNAFSWSLCSEKVQSAVLSVDFVVFL